jgi:hypothetical protein
MKHTFRLLCTAATGMIALPAAPAAPLPATTAIQTRPDAAAPVIGYLKAGSEPTAVATAPDGWMAVSVAGPFNVYVLSADFTKSLDVKPGSPLYLAPKPDGGVLATAAKGDKIQITGVYGRWTRVQLDQPMVGYIHLGPIAPAPLTVTPVPETEPAPTNAPGHPANGSTPGLAGSQFFEGRFASTHRLFLPHRPYEWQLSSPDGARIAYLDVSKLLQTEQMDQYVGRNVEVVGQAARVPGTKDLVISVERLQLE